MYPIQVRCLTTCNGHFSALVVFEFTKEPGVSFSISRYVAAIAESQLAKDLGPSAPFQPYEASLQSLVTVITEDGIPPDRYVIKSPAAILSRGAQPVLQPGQGSLLDCLAPQDSTSTLCSTVTLGLGALCSP